jgi:diaminopimelate epimerase
MTPPRKNLSEDLDAQIKTTHDLATRIDERVKLLVENHDKIESKLERFLDKQIDIVSKVIINEQNIEIQTWERGIGYSLSCGSGAVASFIASNTLGLVALNANIQTCGGLLTASLENKNIIISGKTSFVFEGIYNIPLLK